MSTQTRAYANAHGDPVVVLVTTGTFDVSRLVSLLSSGRCEDVRTAARVRRQVAHHASGRAALRLLADHGGPDFTDDPVGTYERFCDWPGCLVTYHAITGAPDGRPWKRNRRVMLCPGHAGAGHWPDLTGYGSSVTSAVCSCGVVWPEPPATLLVLKGWWQQHVASIPELARP